MTVQMTPGELVYVPFYTDMIEIVAHYMHGDMNGYSTETVFYPDSHTADIQYDLEGLAFIKRSGKGTHEESAELIRAFYESNDNFGMEEECIDAFVDLFNVQDSTDDAYEGGAALVRIEVFWYNDAGQKRQMKVVVDGADLDAEA